MKRRVFILASGLLLLLLLFIRAAPQLTARGQVTNFIIDNADGTNTLSMTGSPDLYTLIHNIQDRIVMQAANASHILGLTSPPAGFTSLLRAAEDRIVIQFANGSQFYPLAAVPQVFSDLLEAVEDRIVLQFANGSHTLALGYPVAMIGDTTAPTVIEVTTSPSGGNLNVIVVSDEYTTAILQYGLAPGVYPNTLADDLFAYAHTFTLPGIASGQIYYYRLTLTDRSGNVTQTAEATLEPLLSIYLPALIHR